MQTRAIRSKPKKTQKTGMNNVLKPLEQYHPKNLEREEYLTASDGNVESRLGDSFRVLQITDIHLDPLYSEVKYTH